jgi:uncharacterized Tic20 family protein
MYDQPALTQPTQYERNWASLAHLTALLTVFVGASTGGVGAVFALLVPLAMYLYFGGRSRYVAFHALQSTVFQALGTVLYVVLGGSVAAAIAVAWTVAGVLTVVLVGLLLMPLALLLTILGGYALVAMPALWVAYSLVGAWRTYNGEPFDYPLVAGAVARTLQTPGTEMVVPANPPAAPTV